VAEVKLDNQDSVSRDDLDDSNLAASGQADDVKPGQAEHSAEPLKVARTECSAEPLKVARTEHSVKGAQRRAPKAQPAVNKNNVVQLSAQRGVIFDKGIWKRSGKKEGYLIRRLPGYSIAETEYGVSYLWVLSRKPDRTTADNSVHPLAGYFNWKALSDSGLLAKERKSDRREAVG
jgi:hypothetical protein